MLHAPPEKPVTRCFACGAATTAGKLYCARPCREAFHNRMSKRGRVAMPIALGWRLGRGSGTTAKDAFAELCAYLDHCNAEDRKAGLPPMTDYLQRVGAFNGGVGWRERSPWTEEQKARLAALGTPVEVEEPADDDLGMIGHNSRLASKGGLV